MNISQIRPGDLVRCDVRGEQFVAEVTQKDDGLLTLEPVGPSPGDLVRCDVRGEQFVAEVTQKDDGLLTLEPVGRSFLPAYRVKSRQVVGHWRKSRRSK